MPMLFLARRICIGLVLAVWMMAAFSSLAISIDQNVGNDYEHVDFLPGKEYKGYIFHLNLGSQVNYTITTQKGIPVYVLLTIGHQPTPSSYRIESGSSNGPVCSFSGTYRNDGTYGTNEFSILLNSTGRTTQYLIKINIIQLEKKDEKSNNESCCVVSALSTIGLLFLFFCLIFWKSILGAILRPIVGMFNRGLTQKYENPCPTCKKPMIYMPKIKHWQCEKCKVNRPLEKRMARAGKKTNQPSEWLAKKPIYEVFLPGDPHIIWPKKCSLCCKSDPDEVMEKTVVYQSGEYLIVSNNKYVNIGGIPVCGECNKSMPHVEQSDLVIGLIGLSVCIALALFSYFVLKNTFVCLLVPLVALVFGIVIALKFAFRTKESALAIDIRTESKAIGKIRPLWMRIKFRSRMFAYEFAEKNGLLMAEFCEECGQRMLLDPRTKRLYCLMCDF